MKIQDKVSGALAEVSDEQGARLVATGLWEDLSKKKRQPKAKAPAKAPEKEEE